MKRILLLLLVMGILLLNACAEPTTAPEAEAPTTAPPTEATPTPPPEQPVPTPEPESTESEPTPTSPSEPTPETKTDREAMIEILKANAKAEWGDDYEMVKYTVDNQIEAYEWIMRQTAYPDIMERAKQKWGGDYEMVKYEYENQVEAYKALQ